MLTSITFRTPIYESSKKKRGPHHIANLISFFYMPMHEVAPSAVSIADAIEAINCTMNLMVSLFVIVLMFNV